MKIELKNITIRELAQDYQDNAEEGVVGYGGKLDIRPSFQREFVYKDKQRDAVIETVFKGFPLNIMYWAVKEDGNYEIIDGQQRTISICQYVEGDFSVKVGNFLENRAFHNLQDDEQEKILNYKLTVYLCSGEDSEKLEWFKIVNIAGERLFDQEIRNAVFSGSWVSAAKRLFSKSNCPAHGLGGDYLSGYPIRQDYLETAITWICNSNLVKDIEKYMADHQHEPNAIELWLYFQSVINWARAVFPNYRNEMKGVPWGFLYNEFKDKNLDADKLEQEVLELMMDDEVNNKKEIYEYVLTRKEKHLNLRSFTKSQKREVYEKQKGICPICKEHFKIEEMEADHITPWHEGGKTVVENCQMLCKEDNRRKSGK
jgi:hypothetical protein